ncbi:NADP-dependent oxidoreductase [Candidatus Daviesbacteria bacterium]|nr:NADP-dependent oxidoreductase [Candidatus Daviesbacteria bacterium]
MKAAQINQYGGSEVIEINNNAPKPGLKNGQVLVEVFASSLNPIDYKIRLGFLKNAIKSFPVTLGTDFAGIVVEVFDGVTEFKIGDEVYGNAIVLGGGSGTLAEFSAAKVGSMALKPSFLDFIQSAALPLAGASALQAIEDHIKLKNNQKILIQGGGGGIGSLAIQLAKMHGAIVVATTSSQTLEFVKSLGADEVIDYTSQNFENLVKNVDAVFDTVGGETAEKSLKVLKKGGIIVSMAAQFDPEQVAKYGVSAILTTWKKNIQKAR